jgi:hypothetical protein
MQIIASSIKSNTNNFLHAGYVSAPLPFDFVGEPNTLIVISASTAIFALFILLNMLFKKQLITSSFLKKSYMLSSICLCFFLILVFSGLLNFNEILTAKFTINLFGVTLIILFILSIITNLSQKKHSSKNLPINQNIQKK